MKNLKYLDYRMVDDESILVARDKYMDAIITLEAEAKVEKQKKLEADKKAELEVVYNVHATKVRSNNC